MRKLFNGTHVEKNIYNLFEGKDRVESCESLQQLHLGTDFSLSVALALQFTTKPIL